VRIQILIAKREDVVKWNEIKIERYGFQTETDDVISGRSCGSDSVWIRSWTASVLLVAG
jgi:hypothetical protein